ncbi:hypothetical protein FRC10_002090 [Ceratobasidium sp. 414]|nr:hypothetical protein FRC10_002090 [Ceratobasidium sp. 414]
MSFPESIAAPAEYALHSNPYNIEPSWYGLWNEIMIEQRNEGATRAESTIQAFKDKPKTPPPPDGELSDNDPEPSEINRQRDQSYKGKGGVQDLFLIEPRPGASVVPSGGQHSYSLPSILRTPERPSSTQKAKELSSAETQVLNRSRDPYFMLDFAIIKILAPTPPGRIIFGYNVQRRDTHVPIVLEAKKVPSRQIPAPGPELDFQNDLSHMLLAGYGDINLKVPAAFRCHPLQQSIIGIVTCGIWWSFTVVSRDESNTTWSSCFVYGNSKHDAILRSLFQAAADSSSDPVKSQNGRIKKCLMSWKRTTYDKYDALAVDRIQ